MDATPLVEHYLSASEYEKELILVLDPDLQAGHVLAGVLRAGGFTAVCCQRVDYIGSTLRAVKPDLIIVAVNDDLVGNRILLQSVTQAFPRCPVIALMAIETAKIGVEIAVELLKSGAADVLVKPVEAPYLSKKIRQLLAAYISENTGLLDRRDFPSITSREFDVLQLIVFGKTSKEAAILLGISKRTIDTHRSNLIYKFGAKNTAELTRLAIA